MNYLFKKISVGLALSLIAVIGLEGCTTNATFKPKSTEQKLTDAATSPLKDLNLIKDSFPEVVESAAKKGLSIKNQKLTCKEIEEELIALNDALGYLPGEESSPAKKEKSFVEKGTAEAESLVVTSVKTTTQDIVPFRSLLKRLTGAAKAEAHATKILDASRLRKAYLLGVKQGQDCISSTVAENAAQ